MNWFLFIKNEEIFKYKTFLVYYFSFQVMKSFDKLNESPTTLDWNATALVDNVILCIFGISFNHIFIIMLLRGYLITLKPFISKLIDI